VHDDEAAAVPAAADRFRLLLGLARDITARHDVEDVLRATLAGLRELISFSGGSIQMLDDDGWIRMAAADPPATPDVMALRIPLGSTVGGRVILTEQPIYLPQVPEPDAEHVTPGGIASYFGVPLAADGRAIGLLQLDSIEFDAWSEDDRLLLVAVAPIVAAAVQNARSYARATAAQHRFNRLRSRHVQAVEALESVAAELGRGDAAASSDLDRVARAVAEALALLGSNVEPDPLDDALTVDLSAASEPTPLAGCP
jgi:GAF domain-containing protein